MFTIIDKVGMSDMETETLADQLEYAKKRMASKRLQKFARGKVFVVNDGVMSPSSWAASIYGSKAKPGGHYSSKDDSIALLYRAVFMAGRNVPVFVGQRILYHEIGHRIFRSVGSDIQAWYASELDSAGSMHDRPYFSGDYEEDFSETFSQWMLRKTLPKNVQSRFFDFLNAAVTGKLS